MLTRQTGIVLVVIGIVAALVGGLANPLGLGEPGFHWKQGLLLGVGIVIAIVGAVIAWRASSPGNRPDSDAPQVQDPDP